MATSADLQALVEAVRANAHIADARHAGDLSLCIYLLQMREFFRWERGLAFDVPLDRKEVGVWIAEREALWDRVEHDTWHALPCGPGRLVDPFDSETVDRWLRPLGWTYSAGLVGAEQPVFFVGERYTDERREGVALRVAGREWVRGLQAPIAMLSEQHASPVIVVRRESLARWCWERVEAYRLRPRPGSAQDAAMQIYGLTASFAEALPRWLKEQTEAAVLHEQGEHAVGQKLGPAWRALRLALPTRRDELFARGVRDLLVDCSLTLQTLLARGAAGPLHVWFANFEGVRALLYPGLPNAYAAWRAGDGGSALGEACASGAVHFEQVARQALDLHKGASPAHDATAAARFLQSPEAVCVA